jgi:hypothetical protein
MFPVRYGLDLYILFRRNSVFKGLKRYGVGMEWVHLAQGRVDSGSRDHGNGSSGLVKFGGFLE